MSVTLNPPNQLGFPRPLTAVVKRSLFIQNPHSSPVAFKVKTTAPKQYCVRPNQGRVEPNETVEVHIVLQPLPVDPPPHAKCKDKFLVQSTFIPPDEEIRTLPEMWSAVERTNKAAIHEQKIRCAYLAAEDGSGDPNGIPEENEDSHLDHSKLDESWTLESERDLTRFRNGGYTVWEDQSERTERAASRRSSTATAPESISRRSSTATAPERSSEPLQTIRLEPASPASAPAPAPPKFTPKSSIPPPPVLTRAPTPPPQRHEIIVKLETVPLSPAGASCNNCAVVGPPPALPSPDVGIFSAAEASPAPKVNGAHKEFAAVSSPLAAGAGVAAAAGAATGAAGVAVVDAAPQPPSPTPGSREIPGLPAVAAAPAPPALAKELPALTAADIAAVAPTNIALEKSINASTPDSEKLAVALAEIERLKVQLAEAQGPAVTGLRKRGGASIDAAPGAKTTTATAPAAASGVPVEVCAGLVFAVFVLTYLFF